MNEAKENQFLELDSVKTEIEPTIYDDFVAESSTAEEKRALRRAADELSRRNKHGYTILKRRVNVIWSFWDCCSLCPQLSLPLF